MAEDTTQGQQMVLDLHSYGDMLQNPIVTVVCKGEFTTVGLLSHDGNYLLIPLQSLEIYPVSEEVALAKHADQSMGDKAIVVVVQEVQTS